MNIKANLGKITIYASSYCVLDSNVIIGGGTDETDILQEILDKALEWNGLHLIMDGAALIRGLQIHSNTTIECLNSDCGFYLADGANDCVIRNSDISENKRKNKNITLKGGTYNHNCVHQSSNPPEKKCVPFGRCCSDMLVAMRFFGVENFKMEDVTICDQKRYGLIMGNWKDVYISNVHIPLPNINESPNQDGLHFHGPGQNLVIKNCYGRANDDFIAINTDEGDKKSSISDVLIDGVFLEEGAYQGVRLLCCEGGELKNVVIRNVSGTVRNFGFLIHPFFPEKSGIYKNISVEQVSLKQTCYVDKYVAPTLFLLGGIIENITIKDITVETDSSEFSAIDIREADHPIFECDAKAPTVVKNLMVDGLYIKDISNEDGERQYIKISKDDNKMTLRNINANCNKLSNALIHIKDSGKVEEINLFTAKTVGFSKLISGKCENLNSDDIKKVE